MDRRDGEEEGFHRQEACDDVFSRVRRGRRERDGGVGGARWGGRRHPRGGVHVVGHPEGPCARGRSGAAAPGRRAGNSGRRRRRAPRATVVAAGQDGNKGARAPRSRSRQAEGDLGHGLPGRRVRLHAAPQGGEARHGDDGDGVVVLGCRPGQGGDPLCSGGRGWGGRRGDLRGAGPRRGESVPFRGRQARGRSEARPEARDPGGGAGKV